MIIANNPTAQDIDDAISAAFRSVLGACPTRDVVETPRARYHKRRLQKRRRARKAHQMHKDGHSVQDIARELGVQPITVVGYLKREDAE